MTSSETAHPIPPCYLDGTQSQWPPLWRIFSVWIWCRAYRSAWSRMRLPHVGDIFCQARFIRITRQMWGQCSLTLTSLESPDMPNVDLTTLTRVLNTRAVCNPRSSFTGRRNLEISGQEPTNLMLCLDSTQLVRLKVIPTRAEIHTRQDPLWAERLSPVNWKPLGSAGSRNCSITSRRLFRSRSAPIILASVERNMVFFKFAFIRAPW
jgi:hypothetical protein